MRRLAVCVLVATAFAAGCTSGEVTLRRGPLGPAEYLVTLGVSGTRALRSETVRAYLNVEETADGARLRLRVDGTGNIEAHLGRAPNGQFVLQTVEGVSPRSAGEADLASIVGQLDPPLPPGPVRMRDRWSALRSIQTDAVTAKLTSDLQLVGYRRVAGRDAALIQGTVRGTLATSGATGKFTGTVSGTTSLVWGVRTGHLLSASTRITWSIPELGNVVVTSDVAPG